MRCSLVYTVDIVPGKDLPEPYRDVETHAILADRLGRDAIRLAEHPGRAFTRVRLQDRRAGRTAESADRRAPSGHPGRRTGVTAPRRSTPRS